MLAPPYSPKMKRRRRMTRMRMKMGKAARGDDGINKFMFFVLVLFF